MKLHKNIIDSAVKNSLEKILSDKKLLDENYVIDQKSFSNTRSESISKDSLDSHIGLYKGYVENLNRISREIDTVNYDKSSSNNSDVRSLKIDETYNANGAYLHELYFNNCYDKNSKIYTDSLSHMKLEKEFGDFYKWQADFLACGLAAREGWVVCGYNFFVKKIINTVIDDHCSNVQIGFYPLIVVDMWSHTYAKDFGTNKKDYLESQMKELNWGMIDNRFKKIEKMLDSIKSDK